LDWPDFVVVVLYGFLVDPRLPLSIFEYSKFAFGFAFMLKNIWLEFWGLVEDTLCGTCDGSDNVGSGGPTTGLKNYWTLVLVRYQAYNELGTHLDETSNLDYSVADEEFLKCVARELLLPGFIFLTKTFLEVFPDTLVIEGECWSMWDTKALTVCRIPLYEPSALWRIRGKVNQSDFPYSVLLLSGN
jgi:hypothetical protein